MAPIVAPCFQVGLQGLTNGGRPWTIVQHWIGAGSSPPEADTGATLWAADFIAHVLPLLCHDTSVTGVTYADLSSLSGISGSLALTPINGGDSGFMAPPNVCGLVTCSATGTRAQRNGRMYLPGMNEDQIQANGDFTETYVNDLNGGLSDFQEALQGDFIIPVVLSKATGGGYEVRTIQDMTLQGLAATQRRRLRR